MATKQTPKKPTRKQVSKSVSTPKATRWIAFAHRRYVIRILRVVVYTVAVVALVMLILHACGWHGETKRSSTDNSMAQTQPVPLAQNTQQLHACSDSIRSITSYTYSAHYFFNLMQQGYHLAGTLSQQASDGRGFTADDCAAYFAVRATHPADHIILQLFTRDATGNLLPYQYKDLKPDSCYSSNTTHRTVCPYAPLYGIFIKD